MQKVPTLFRRNPDDRRFVLPEVEPGCEWVLAGEGVGTRKYDGVCFLFDPHLDEEIVPTVAVLHGWWARREVKLGRDYPAAFVPVEHDSTTGKTVGWEPAEASPFARLLEQAVARITDGPRVGTHELIGPKIRRNPERVAAPTLVAHADAEVLDAPRDYEALRRWLPAQPYIGVVWHHPDGRMAQIERRDFPAVTA